MSKEEHQRCRKGVCMFPTRWTTTLLEQARRQQRPAAFLLQALLALSSLLVLASACGTETSKNAVPAPVAQTQVVRQVQLQLAPAPAISTTVRTLPGHLYLFSRSNVGLMQPAVDARGNVWAGEMNVNRLGRLDSKRGVVTSWTPVLATWYICSRIMREKYELKVYDG